MLSLHADASPHLLHLSLPSTTAILSPSSPFPRQRLQDRSLPSTYLQALWTPVLGVLETHGPPVVHVPL